MSWTFEGSNCIVFSGETGKQEYELCKAKVGEAGLVMPPQYPKDNVERFIAKGWMFVFRAEK